MKKRMKKKCARCGKDFYTRGNFSLRCSPCRKIHIAEYQKKYVVENRAIINKRLRGEYAQARRQKHPEKARARDILNNAIKSGKVIKKPCIKCGSTKRIHGHHPNYSKPLKVVWLCPIHHSKVHK